jgi:hypothetical protein
LVLPFYHITVDAKLATLGHFSEASAATGPLMSVPLVSPSGVINTAALSSKQTLTPFNLRTAYFCLTITAPYTCFLNSAGPFFTTTLQKSPTAAAGSLDALVLCLGTLITSKILAPELSAHTMLAPTGIDLVTYGRNSSTPFPACFLPLCFYLNYYI